MPVKNLKQYKRLRLKPLEEVYAERGEKLRPELEDTRSKAKAKGGIRKPRRGRSMKPVAASDTGKHAVLLDSATHLRLQQLSVETGLPMYVVATDAINAYCK